MFEPMFLWVTRSAPYNLLTAHRLRAVGHNVWTEPILDIRPVASPTRSVAPDAIAFTGAQGVRHHPCRREWLGLPVFTVGDRTAEAARRSGYRDVRSAGGDLADLQNLIAATLPRPSRLVHFSAREPSGDLCGYLVARGFEAVRQVVYEAEIADGNGLERIAAVLPTIDGVVVHSSRAGRHAAQLIAASRWYGMIFCLSEKCAEPFRRLPGLLVETAVRPTEESLIDLLRAWRGRRHRPTRLRPLHSTLRTSARRHLAEARPVAVANDNPMLAARGWPAPGPEGPDDPPPTAA